jgi:hypothetical protein
MFERAERVMINNRWLVRGTEVTVTGEGRFKFLGVVRNVESGVEWIDCVDKNHRLRSFHVDKVKRVHYKKKLGV